MFFWKIRSSYCAKTGYDNPLQNPEVREKIKQHFLATHGVEYYSQTDEYKRKYQATCIERFGFSNPNQNEDIKAKVSLSFTLDEYKARLAEPNLKDEEVRSRIESIIEFRNAFTDPYSELFEEKSFATNGKNYKGVYEYTYTYTNFSDNSVLNNCFENFGVQEDKEKIYIFAEGKSKCAPFKLIVISSSLMLDVACSFLPLLFGKSISICSSSPKFLSLCSLPFPRNY